MRMMAYSEVTNITNWSHLSSLTYEGSKNKEYAGEHPGLYCRQTLRLGGVGGDRVEDVDQHQEQGDQEGHPARYYVRGNNETKQ